MASISPERREMLAREKQKNAAGGGNYFSTKDLTAAIIRLTPLQPDEGLGTKLVRYFFNNRFHVCNEATHGKPGVIARAIRALQKIDDPVAKGIADNLDDNRKQRYVTKIIVRGSEADGVKFFEMPRSIYDILMAAFVEDEDDISHPLEGRDVRISKSGSGINTEYSARIKDPCPLMPSKEERMAIRSQSQAMSIADEIKANEQSSMEALISVIPPEIWSQIVDQVTNGLNLDVPAAGGRPAAGRSSAPNKPAPTRRPVADDEDAAPPKKAQPVDEDEGAAPAPAPKPKAAAIDEEAPKPKAAAKPASKPTAVDEDEDAPVVAPKAAAKPAPADEDVAPAKSVAKVAAKPAAAAPRYAAASSDDE